MYRVYNFLNALFLKTAYATYDPGTQGVQINNDLTKKIIGGFATIYNLLKEVIPWVAIVMTGFAVFKLATGDEKQVQTAKKQLFWIFGGLIGFYLAPMIVSTIETAFNVKGA